MHAVWPVSLLLFSRGLKPLENRRLFSSHFGFFSRGHGHTDRCLILAISLKIKSLRTCLGLAWQANENDNAIACTKSALAQDLAGRQLQLLSSQHTNSPGVWPPPLSQFLTRPPYCSFAEQTSKAWDSRKKLSFISFFAMLLQECFAFLPPKIFLSSVDLFGNGAGNLLMEVHGVLFRSKKS